MAALRTVQEPGSEMKLRELHAELARAELTHKISEFQALVGRAILAMFEQSEFATDYLNLAEAIAASKHERALIAQARATLDWLRAPDRAAG